MAASRESAAPVADFSPPEVPSAEATTAEEDPATTAGQISNPSLKSSADEVPATTAAAEDRPNTL
jgi:hypothetical protein